MTKRYFARSASDKTDDWPFWYVADREKGNLNVTVKLEPLLEGALPFTSKEYAIRLAKRANEEGWK